MADIGKLEENETFKQIVVKWLFWGTLFFLGLLIVLLIIVLFDVCFPATLGESADSMGQCEIGTLIERLGFAIGGTVALLIGLASYERAAAQDKTAKAQVESAKAQNETAKAQNRTARAQEKGNIEERYKNAILQLGDEKEGIRLGGIYGLYHLAKDNESNKTYRRSICDVLCAHVRVITTSKDYEEKYSEKPSNEIQTILDLLTKKKDEEEIPFESKWIDFSGAFLNSAELERACLEDAKLREVHLQSAILWQAHLGGIDLCKARLESANLYEARLEAALMSEAHLECARLTEAHLEGAILNGSYFHGASLLQAHLESAYLRGAFLEGASLIYAHLEDADLCGAFLEGADLSGAHLESAYLKEAHLVGAHLKEAHLEATYLNHAKFQEAILEGTDFRGAVGNKKIIRSRGHVLEQGIERLEERTMQKSELTTVIFRGSVSQEYVEDFNERKEEIEKRLMKVFKGKDFDWIKSPLNKVKVMLERHKDIKEDYNIPKKYESTIKTGILPEEDTKEIITRLEKVKEELKKKRGKLWYY